MMTDPIADMLTRIRNASLVHKEEVFVPFSKIKMSIAEILVRQGYLSKAEKISDKKPEISLKLKYTEGEPVIQHLERVSRPGRRCYVKNGEIKQVLNGFGLAILSTPRGVLTDAEARREKVGGELICQIY